jgi:hypothetical protein
MLAGLKAPGRFGLTIWAILAACSIICSARKHVPSLLTQAWRPLPMVFGVIFAHLHVPQFLSCILSALVEVVNRCPLTPDPASDSPKQQPPQDLVRQATRNNVSDYRSIAADRPVRMRNCTLFAFDILRVRGILVTTGIWCI